MQINSNANRLLFASWHNQHSRFLSYICIHIDPIVDLHEAKDHRENIFTCKFIEALQRAIIKILLAVYTYSSNHVVANISASIASFFFRSNIARNTVSYFRNTRNLNEILRFFFLCLSWNSFSDLSFHCLSYSGKRLSPYNTYWFWHTVYFASLKHKSKSSTWKQQTKHIRQKAREKGTTEICIIRIHLSNELHRH